MSNTINGDAGRFAAVEAAVCSTTEDGMVYEDAYITVTREDGRITMTGKPIQPVFIYAEDK